MNDDKIMLMFSLLFTTGINGISRATLTLELCSCVAVTVDQSAHPLVRVVEVSTVEQCTRLFQL